MPIQVSALHQLKCLAQRKDESCLSCEVMKFRNECCVWSCPTVCLLRLGRFTSESAWMPQVSYIEGQVDSTGLCTQQVMLAQVHWAALILRSAESATGHSRAMIKRLKAALRRIHFFRNKHLHLQRSCPLGLYYYVKISPFLFWWLMDHCNYNNVWFIHKGNTKTCRAANAKVD